MRWIGRQWRRLGAFAAMIAGATVALGAPDIGLLQRNGAIERLFAQTGVYHRPATARTPEFVVDPAWPRPLPHSWLLGQIGGLYVDRHDHVWVYNRPRTLTDDEAGLEDGVPGATDADGKPVNGLGYVRAYGATADCCRAAPSVLEFDAGGNLLQAWGGPSDPGFVGGRCKPADGCIWPSSEHGIYVDEQDNVWLAGNAPAPAATAAVRPATPWTTNREGGDGFVLKFDRGGNFKLRIGGTPRRPDSNDRAAGLGGTPLLYRPTDMVVDPKTNRLFISDGYGNRHVLIVDAATGKYLGSIGAYGNNPVDDAAAEAAGPWMNDYSNGRRKPAFFRGPVHCVKISTDGKLYVCDRGNDRIQVFDARDPALGRPCANPQGAAGRCGFIAEQFISGHTNTSIPGTAVSINFSTDQAQTCLYVGDNSNGTIYILNRATLRELGRLGHPGRMAGDFHWLHQVSTDRQGDVYTAEVDTAKRIQKFLRYGAIGCGGEGWPAVGGPPTDQPAR